MLMLQFCVEFSICSIISADTGIFFLSSCIVIVGLGMGAATLPDAAAFSNFLRNRHVLSGAQCRSGLYFELKRNQVIGKRFYDKRR